ncbi:MAG: hypothetical protein HW403_1271, partial [Dehalococcoidia bacterium]|nr:hypothetical protein [Dehalococcoidia bacterium]
MARLLLVYLAVMGFAASLALAGQGEALAAASGRIEGWAYNATTGGSPLASAQVTLLTYVDGNQTRETTLTADGEGRFQFSDLDTGSTYTYEVTVRYLEIQYRSVMLTFPQGVDRLDISLPVYEITKENPGIQALSVSLVLAGVEENSRMILAMERVSLYNPSDRTYVPNRSGPEGPMSFLRFGLPPGAVNLTPHEGLNDGEVVQSDRGFASTMPLLPGEHEVVYAYRFPYQSSKVAFTKSFLYGAGEFLLLAPKDTWEVDGPGLDAEESVTIGNREYRL